jgi:hypothetical protein
MEGADEKDFEYGAFHEPTNPGTHEPIVMDDEKYVKCRKVVGQTCIQKE